MAKIIQNSPENLFECAKNLKSSNLVAFPTETVYGIGAILWNEDAINKIFIAKNRPKTDPLIVHVQNVAAAKKLISLTQDEQKCFDILAEKFWPGPLTIVLKSAKNIPKMVMGNGVHVGIRVPSHPVLQALLLLCDAPIAAPSANKFGHVSPTRAQHVLDDLKSVQDLLIIDDNNECNIGIESTVIKIEKNTIHVLRPGAITTEDISAVLKEHAINKIILEKNQYIQQNSTEYLVENKNVSRETFLEKSPGQRLTHYSPWIETFVILDCKKDKKHKFPIQKQQKISHGELEQIALVDFGKNYAHFKQNVFFYSDLSETKNYQEAAQKLFHTLREIENRQGIKKILIADLYSDSKLATAVFDRIYRAASGKFAEF